MRDSDKDITGGAEGGRRLRHKVGVSEARVANAQACKGRLPATALVERVRPGRDGGFHRAEFIRGKASPRGLPLIEEKIPKKGVIVSSRDTGETGTKGDGGGSSTSQRVGPLIARDACMARHPAEADRLVADRQPE